MGKTFLSFPVVSFKKTDTIPTYGRESYATHIINVNIKDIPEMLESRRDINVRDANEKSYVYGRILESLVDDPEMFFYKNRGLTIIADSVRFENKTNEVVMSFSDPEIHGLLDGGHTFTAIMEYLATFAADEDAADAYVKIEVITGVEDLIDIVSIVESRNTAAQVKDQGIQELRGTFDAIHSILDSSPYGDRIHYSEFELNDDGIAKDIDIKDILSCLICFDTDNFGPDRHPVIAYNGKKATLKHFVANRESLSKYLPLLPKILELYDVIYKELPIIYNTMGSFGLLTGVAKITAGSRRKPVELKYIQSTSEYVIPKGFIMPILASLRLLVVTSRNTAKFIDNPIEVFRRNGKALAKKVVDRAQELKNPNTLGKTASVWDSCYDVIDRYIIKTF